MAVRDFLYTFAVEIIYKYRTMENRTVGNENFLSILRRAKQRKKEWEERVGARLEVMQRELDKREELINTYCQ